MADACCFNQQLGGLLLYATLHAFFINSLMWESTTPKNNELKNIRKKSCHMNFPKKVDERTKTSSLSPRTMPRKKP